MNLNELLDQFIDKNCPTETLWEKLALEGNFELIEKLRYVERCEKGFGTIIVPEDGFSESDEIHNLVLDWLKERNINVVNVTLIKSRLESTLRR